MKIGVMSDTHNNGDAVLAALDALRRKDVSVIIHCGDLTSAQLLPLFEGFEMHFVQGNMDNVASIARAVRKLGNNSTYSTVFEAELEGVRVAAIHGDDKPTRRELQASGLYDYVFHGHSHERKDKIKGKTHVINPGALGGKRVESRSCCVVNLKTGQVCFIEFGQVLEPQRHGRH